MGGEHPIRRKDIDYMLADALDCAGVFYTRAELKLATGRFLLSLSRALRARGRVKIRGFMTGKLRSNSCDTLSLKVTLQEKENDDGCAIEDFTDGG